MRILVLLCGLGSLAAARPRYELDARVDAQAGTVDGHERLTIENAGPEPLEVVHLWRYAERFATRSTALNDFNFYWVYPRAFNPGSLRTGPVVVDGAAAPVEVLDHAQAGPRTLLAVTLPRPLAAGARAVIELDFHTQIPARYGGFGCHRGTCTLAGGWYPMLADRDLSSPPLRGDYQVTVRVARVSDVVLQGELHPVERGGAATAAFDDARAASLVVGRPRLRTVAAEHRGVRIVVLTSAWKGMPSPPEHLLPYLPADRTWRMIAAAREAIDMLAELGAPVPPGRTIRIVEGQLRIEPAQSLPGFVLVSDRLFDIFPLARFLKFHEFQLVRAIYQQELDERTRAHERADDGGWSADVAASWLVDAYTLRTYRREEFARQILSWAGFIPAIDRILYAPQVPFASAYFNTLEDTDPLRDGLDQFNHTRPRGKTVYSKLRDLLGDAGIERVVRRQLDGAPIRSAAEAVRGESLDWFFRQWLGPYPPVDYRFVDVHSQPRVGGGVVVTAVVEKRTAATDVVEPVLVRARDRHGRATDLIWDGQGARHSYVFELAAPLDLLEIDPRGRLVETLPGNNDDLRFNDRRPPRWKFIYNNFGGLIRVFPTLGFDLSLDFNLERILDIKNAMRFIVYHTDSTQIGVLAEYTRSFGRKITAARLSSAFSASLSGARIDPSFGRAVGAGEHPGTAMAAGVGIGYDDRLFVWEPQRARSFGLSAAYALTVLDDGQTLSQGTVSASAETILRLGDGHGLALLLSGAVTGGSLKIARQMLAAGGPSGLRGYDIDQLLGRGRLLARVEYRHVIVHDLDLNVLHSLYLRGIGGGLFAEAGMTTACESYSVGEKNLAADVGYTIRLFADWFGVSQTTFNLDIAIPLVRQDRQCFGPLTPDSHRTPIGIFFAFGPPW